MPLRVILGGMEEHMMTAQEVADEVGVHLRTIRRWTQEGTLTAYRVGPKAIRYRASDVDAIMQPVEVNGR